MTIKYTTIRPDGYFSELAKKRKNPYLPFKDPEYAKKMSALAVLARAKKKAERDGNTGSPTEQEQ